MSEVTGISERPVFLSIFLVLTTIFLGFVVIGPLIGFFIAMPFYEGNIMDLTTQINNPTSYPELKLPILIIQGTATLVGLILIPWLYLKAIEKKALRDFIYTRFISFWTVGAITLMVISFMATNSVFIEWNSNFVFPDFLKEFGAWAREREELAEKLTKFFTTFGSTGEFLLGVVVIAVLPAIGEELAFRGMLQPEFFRLTGNHHASIWITAIIFSAFHMQFFGFVPRMLLGALFGYLYLWSGNLFWPILAHFVNNGFSVLMIYLHQLEIVTMDIDSPEAAPWPAVVGFTIVAGLLLYYFKKTTSHKPPLQA